MMSSTVSSTNIHLPGTAGLVRSSATEVLRVPHWRQYKWLAHGFSTRQGGVSTVYRQDAREGSEAKSRRARGNRSLGELNLGFTASDTHENVLRNREMFLHAVLSLRGVNHGRKASSPIQLVLLRQIHSGLVRGWTHPSVEKLVQEGIIPRCDGSITDDPGLMLAIQTADCLSILVADVRQRVVAAFHAGWRGTLARIVERGVGRMRAEFRSRPEDLTAAIGPGIGRCCYAVGEEVRMEFESQFHYADSLFHEVFESDPIRRKYPLLFLTARAPGHSGLGPQIHLDLEEANRRQLLAAGVQPGKIYAMGLCTACNVDRFFSYRAEDGFTGRMLSVIGRLN